MVVKPAFDLPLLETECESCGQCITSCPTGALAAKLNLAKPGPWELTTTATTCGYCSDGCTLELKTRGRLLAEVTPREDSTVDGGNLCRRGRFGPALLPEVDRLNQPLVRLGEELTPVSWDEAWAHIAKMVAALKATSGPEARAVFASPRLTNEELYLLQKWAREDLGTNNLNSFTQQGPDPLAQALGKGAGTSSLAEVPAAETLLVVGAKDLSLTHSLAALKVKEAVKQGAKVVTIGPRDETIENLAHQEFNLPAQASTLLLEALLAALIEEDLVNGAFIAEKTSNWEALKARFANYDWKAHREETHYSREEVVALARLWAESKTGMILYDEYNLTGEAAAFLVDLALISGKIGQPRRGIIPLRPKGNSQGLLDLGITPTHLPGHKTIAQGVGMDTQAVLASLAAGRIKGLFLFGEDPVGTATNQAEMAEALTRASFLLVQDITLTETAKLADVVLPAATFIESEGTFTSAERRIQPLRPALAPPGGLQNWQVLLALGKATGSNWDHNGLGELWQEIIASVPDLARASYQSILQGKVQWGGPILYQDGFATPDGKAVFLLPKRSRLLKQGHPYQADILEKIFADKLQQEGFRK